MQYANQFVANMHFHLMGGKYMTYVLCFYELDMLRCKCVSIIKKILDINFTSRKMEIFAYIYISNKHLSVQIMHTLMEIVCFLQNLHT